MSIELREGKGAYEQEVRLWPPATEPAVGWHRPWGEKRDLQGRAGSWRWQLWRGPAGSIGGDTWEKGKERTPPGRE